MGHERLDDSARRGLDAFLTVGNPHSEVATLLQAKEAVRQFYEIEHHSNAVEYLNDLVDILTDDTLPPEANTLGRTLKTWATQITNWHLGRYSNGPTEGANNRVKRVKGCKQLSRLWNPPIRPPPNPGPALRRRPELGPTRHHHTPLKRGAPHYRVLIAGRPKHET